MTDHIPAEAVEAGARALFEESQELDQDNSWDDALPDDWRAAWRYQAREVIAAALPFLRPEPSEDEREALDRLIVEHDPDGRHPDDQRRCPCGELIGESDGLVVTTDPYGHLRDVILATGFTRRPMPSREQIARVIYDCDDLERAVLVDAERIADAVLALFEKGAEG